MIELHIDGILWKQIAESENYGRECSVFCTYVNVNFNQNVKYICCL